MIDQKKILVIGTGGQLANEFSKTLPEAQFIGLPIFDITDPDAYNKLSWENFDVVINATAYTNVDGAETPEGRRSAWQVNAKGVGILSQYAIQHNCTLVHISTDYVFDGTLAPHSEDEPVAPLNVYGQSKAAGELCVSLVPKHYLIRTEWLIGDGKNFVKTMYELGRKGVTPKVVSDQTGRLTFTSTLVAGILHLLETKAGFGTYHLSNSGPIRSWVDVANAIFEGSGLSQRATPITTKEYFQDKPEAAKRPLSSAFNLNKIIDTGFTPPDWQEELMQYLTGLNSP